MAQFLLWRNSWLQNSPSKNEKIRELRESTEKKHKVPLLRVVRASVPESRCLVEVEIAKGLFDGRVLRLLQPFGEFTGEDVFLHLFSFD